MNKIFNWTIGSLFRTFGRILAYLLLGGLIALILSKNSIKLPKISDLLLFEHVQAKSSNVFLQNVTIDDNPTVVPTLGWYYNQSYSRVIPVGSSTGQWNNVVDFSFDEATFPANAESFIVGFWVHNSDSATQSYYYDAYSSGYEIYQNEKVMWSFSVYYDGSTGFNYCDPVGNNGEFFYFKCGVVSDTIGKFKMTFKVNEVSYNVTSSSFRFAIRSALTLDVANNDVASIIQNDTANTQAIINNQNSSTNSIIQNQNQTTQEIIDNQNQNTQETIKSQEVCIIKKYGKESIDETSLGFLRPNGNISSSSAWKTTQYINIKNSKNLKMITQVAVTTLSNTAICFYEEDKTLISCIEQSTITRNINITIPQNTEYMRFAYSLNSDIPTYEIEQCKNGNQAMTDTITDDDVGEAENSATSFFDDFEVSDHGGLSGIITAPLNTISNLVSNTCSPLVLPLPFVNENLTLPCLDSIYSQHFGAFYTIYQAILLAIISYRCIRSLFYDTRGFINPEDDRIEVLDL